MDPSSEVFSTEPEGTKKIVSAAFVYSALFFIAGLVYDLILYITCSDWTMCGVNTASIILVAAVFATYRVGKSSSPDTGMLISMLIISANIAFTIIYEGVIDRPDSSFKILLGMCISTMPVILVTLTKYRWAAPGITIVMLCAFIASAALLRDDKLFYSMPALLLIYIGAPIALKNIIVVSRHLERQAIAVTEEKEEFLRLMNIGIEHLNFIEAHGRKEATELIDKLDNKIRDTLILRAREVITSEEAIKEALKNAYPSLTDAEIEVAVLVVNDKTVSEICAIRHVAPSTVTSIRSRLRKKMGVPTGTSLKGRLTAVANHYNSKP